MRQLRQGQKVSLLCCCWRVCVLCVCAVSEGSDSAVGEDVAVKEGAEGQFTLLFSVCVCCLCVECVDANLKIRRETMRTA